MVAVVGRCLEGSEHYSAEKEVDNKHLIVASFWFSLFILRLMCSVRPTYDETQMLPCQLTVIGQVNVAVMSKSESSLGQDAVTTLRLPQSLQIISGQYLA